VEKWPIAAVHDSKAVSLASTEPAKERARVVLTPAERKMVPSAKVKRSSSRPARSEGERGPDSLRASWAEAEAAKACQSSGG
jgi:hypothetical protein